MKEAYTHAQISRNNELKDTLILTTGDIGRYIWQHLHTSLLILAVLFFFFYLPGVWNGGMRDVILEKKIWYQHALVCGFPFIFETLMITFFFFFPFQGSKRRFSTFCTFALTALFTVQVSICLWSSIHRNQSFGCS